MKKGAAAVVPTGEQLEGIKRAAIVAMFADDALMDVLVLKGGNAMDIVHQVNSRASVDLDFSMEDDLDHEAVLPNLQRALEATFDLQGYLAFDIKLSIRPGRMPDELASFWGGYLVEFKLISNRRASEVGRDIAQMRREAIRLGEGPKFTIDISRHEYVEHKEAHELDGYTIYVYSPAMIVCEKLRAICQQMPEYGEVIQSALNKCLKRQPVQPEHDSHRPNSPAKPGRQPADGQQKASAGSAAGGCCARRRTARHAAHHPVRP